MAIVEPQPIAALPSAPDPNDRATFNPRAYPWSAALIPWTDEANALAEATHDNALSAHADAVSAHADALAAGTSESNAYGSAQAAAGSALAAASSQSQAATSATTATAQAAIAVSRAAEATAAAVGAQAIVLGVSTAHPAIRPTLLLDFANGRYVGPRITFTRAGTATRINANGQIETVAANVPRIDFDPVSGACKGLLIEEQRTNMLTYSEQLDNSANWLTSRSSVTPNVIVAPDGTLTADKLVESTNTSFAHYLYCRANVTAGTTYTSSFYVKAAERTNVALQFYANNAAFVSSDAFFNIGTGVITNSAQVDSATITPIGNGLHRISATKTATSTALATISVALVSTGTTIDYTGDGTSGVYGWGAQLDAGTFPTSYIPTTTAQVTRAADIAPMTGANFSSWYRQGEGTFVVFARRDALSAGRLLTLSDGTTSNQICINLAVSSASLRADLEVNVGGVLQVSTTTTPVFAVGGMVAIAFAYKDNDFAISVNGTTAVTDTSGTVPAVDRMHIGTDQAGANSHNGTVARIAYYPKRLTNSELQALTA